MSASKKANFNTEPMNFNDDKRLFSGPPEHYFERLPDELMRRLPARQRQTQWERAWRAGRRWVPVAVAMMLVAVVWWKKSQRHPTASSEPVPSEWTVEDEVVYNWDDDLILWEELSDESSTNNL